MGEEGGNQKTVPKRKEEVISKCHLRRVWQIRSPVDHIIRTGAFSLVAWGRKRTQDQALVAL